VVVRGVGDGLDAGVGVLDLVDDRLERVDGLLDGVDAGLDAVAHLH